ncbi:MAG: FHA domain-containing protein [Oscillospiraceae bacterium]|nr:FHA domain-containing protein [Oscillospiraceae bacterium]
MKKAFAWLLSLLFVLALAPSAFAAGPVQTASAYYLDDTLHVFAWFPGFEDEGIEPQAGLLVRNVQVGDQVTGEKLAYTGETAQYMLLVDNSTSMGVYAPRIRAVADAMLAAEKDVSLTIATFGTEFTVLAEGITRADDARTVLSSLTYAERGTDICGGAVHAIDYMVENLWTPGTLANIVLLTDGIPFYARDEETESESERASAAVLKMVLEQSPHIFLHGVCFEQWEEVTHEAVASCGGLDLYVSDAAQGGETGTQLVEWYTSLYELAFPLQNYNSDLGLRIGSMQLASIRRAADLTKREPAENRLPLPGVVDSETGDDPIAEEPEPEPDEPDESETPEDPAEGEPIEEVPDEPEEPSESEPEPEPEPQPAEPDPEPEPQPTEDPAEDEEKTEDEPKSGKDFGSAAEPVKEEQKILGLPILTFVLIAVGAVLLLALLAVLIVLLARRKKYPMSEKPPRAVPSGDALPMRLELRYGAVQGSVRQYWLEDALTLGTDARCDVVLLDQSADPFHARIVREGGMLYIEDLNSSSGTRLGGMRIYSRNPLRPGDEIQLGNTGFVFWF